MIGAIIGDIVGSRFEFGSSARKGFKLFHKDCHFTDDSVMTIAIADAILEWDKVGRPSYYVLSDYAEKAMRLWGRAYPSAGYGFHFANWLVDDSMGPYDSCGNGAAMRISPVGWAARDIEECIWMSRSVTEVTHNHPDGIKGAQATATQIFLARLRLELDNIRRYEESHYYRIKHDLNWLLKNYEWHSLCDGTCQPAYECLYNSTSFEDAIRNCMLIGGDCDTTGAICGGIAEAVWGIPLEIEKKARTYLDEDQLEIVDAFRAKFHTFQDEDLPDFYDTGI